VDFCPCQPKASFEGTVKEGKLVTQHIITLGGLVEPGHVAIYSSPGRRLVTTKPGTAGLDVSFWRNEDGSSWVPALA